jgi:ABC-type branched-subunit amino acid transport system ATPase component/branched-subunit amino acid ABC-type transport system permease component
LDKFGNLFISGAVSGAIYALIASGLSLTYATTGIFNLGFGGVAFAAAFLYYELHSGLNWPVLPAALVTLVVAGPLLGWVLDRYIFGRLGRASDSSKLMAVVGVLIALPALAKWVVGLLVNDGHFNIPTGDQVYVSPGVGPTPPVVWHPFAGLTITSDEVIVFGVAAFLAVALWALLHRTRLGLQMRAATDRPELAQLMGVNRSYATGSAWIIGTTLACIAGIVGAPIINSLDPTSYTTVVFVATAAVVVGGFRSIPLAFAAGLALGVAQNLVAGYASFAQSIQGFNTSVPFVALLVAVLVMGRSRERQAGSVAEDPVPADALDDRPAWRRQAGWLVPSVLLLVYLFFVAGGYWVSVITGGLALALVFLSFVVVTGLGGMVSLAQAAFVTAAGLTAGLLMDQYHMPWLVAFVGGTAVAAALGAVVAVPALRVGGLALSLATLALGFLGDDVLFQWNWFSGGVSGWTIKRPKLGPLNFADNRTMAVTLLLFVLGVAWLIRNLRKSASGRQMAAVRASEPASAGSGISPTTVKLRLFVISAALAGAGGVLLATVNQQANNVTYVTEVGLIWLASAVLWGVRRPLGAVLAGLTAAVFPALLGNGFRGPSWVPSFLSWHGTQSIWLPSVLFGLGAITMAQDPEGILHMMHSRKSRKGAAAPAKPAPAKPAPAKPAPAAARAVDPSEPARAASTASPAAAADGLATDRSPLRLAGVSAAYGELRVLAGLDLALAPGTITALVGANGAGKTTLCKVVAGLLPATEGQVFLGGADITAVPPHRRAGRLMLAPEARGIFPALSVDDNLSVRLPRAADRERVYERFPLIGSRKGIAAGSLSGGEQQILAMAPLLHRPPDVLIADEPTLGLAPLIIAQIIELFTELRSQGTTLLLAEERAKGVLDVADQVILLELGRILWAGPRSDLQQEQLAAIYLGSAQQAVAASAEMAGANGGRPGTQQLLDSQAPASPVTNPSAR